MKITEFPHHIFWSYKKDADLDAKLIARQVFMYGDIGDMLKVVRLISPGDILKALQELKRNSRLQKRTRFIDLIILGKND